ncbi:TetR/AcrR family transcriptional regulator [Kordiimonas aquimaris]|uniref:TetR/AcrR family transcriptional regulator n=1 Tax=Kordiimonas aquimaris TaxID=707591 RepID=UPI0021D01553|nr:TetR/AcrR family transcriptional regulator [Kordiimonas aquimaris]
MARPRKFEEEKVLNAIKNVFWQSGYEGTSYNDLIKASGLHKGSLYAAFGDKHALYLRALQEYDAREVRAAKDLLMGRGAAADMPGNARVIALLQAVVDAVTIHDDRRGCLLCNAAMDQAPYDKDVEKSVAESMASMQEAFESALAEKHAGAALRATASAASAIYFGMRVMVKSGAPIAMLEQAKDGAKSLL